MVNTSAMPISSPPLYVCWLCSNYTAQYRGTIKENHATGGSTMCPFYVKNGFATSKFVCFQPGIISEMLNF